MHDSPGRVSLHGDTVSVSLTFVFKLLVTLHDVFLKNFPASPSRFGLYFFRPGADKISCYFSLQALRLLLSPYPSRGPEGPVPFGTAKVEIFFLPAKIIFLFFSCPEAPAPLFSFSSPPPLRTAPSSRKRMQK